MNHIKTRLSNRNSQIGYVMIFMIIIMSSSDINYILSYSICEFRSINGY
jgi:hypothetical protein